MWAEKSSVRKPNVTTVYKSIDIEKISIDELRKILGDEKPVVQVIPGEVIALIYPELGPLVCVIDNRRVKIETSEYANVDRLVHLAREANRIVSEQNQQIAYGFNYEFLCEDFENKLDFMAQTFLRDSRALEASIQGQLAKTDITLVFNRTNERLQFNLSQEGGTLIAKLNVHFISENIPSEEIIQRSFVHWAQEAKVLLDKLYEASND